MEKSLKKWKHREFTRASALEKYIREIKTLFIGKPLTKVMMMGVIFNEEGADLKDGLEEPYLEDGLEVDEPLVLFIGGNRLEVCNFDAVGSHIELGINSLTFTENSYQNDDANSPHIWRDITSLYFKRCIGQPLEDIYINKTKYTSAFDVMKCSGKDGDDMFYEFCLKFKNGYEIVFYTCINWTCVTERKYCRHREAIVAAENEDREYFNELCDGESIIAEDSSAKESKSFKVVCFPDFYMFPEFRFIIKSDKEESYLFISSAPEESDKFIYCLESLITDRFAEKIFCFEQEGWDSFFRMRKTLTDKIVFQHYTDKIYGYRYNGDTKEYEAFQAYPATKEDAYEEPVCLRHNILVNQRLFIKEFYTAYRNVFKGKEYINKINPKFYNEWKFTDIRSQIIEDYLGE